MKIHSIYLENFRNFKSCHVQVGQNIVLIGENKAGKSNLITGLRLILDPTQNRQLIADDFWDGEGKPFDGRTIKVSIQISDFGGDDPELVPLTWLSSSLVEHTPPIAQLTYEFFLDREEPQEGNSLLPISPDDYKWKIYGANDPAQTLKLSGLWQDMPLSYINALRDLASDSRTWSRSPLNELVALDNNVRPDRVKIYVDEIVDASNRMVTELFGTLQGGIKTRLDTMIGKLYSIDPRLQLDTSTPDALLKALRVFVDGDKNRTITRTSLGLQNAVYLSLLSLQLDKKLQRRQGKNQNYLPIVTLEEPEAHLHPHLQRLVFEDFLRTAKDRNLPVIISSHSPYLVTAADTKDLVLIKDSVNDGSKAFSAFSFLEDMPPRGRKDISRFLDITKSEMVFAKAVLFVEGDTEMLLVRTFCELLSINLDEYGISICNVYGIGFLNIAKLAHLFNIPFAVLTDGDKVINDSNEDKTAETPTDDEKSDAPNGVVPGLKRGIDIVRILEDDAAVIRNLETLYDNQLFSNVRDALNEYGVFVNEWTLEPALLDAGLGDEFKSTFQELGEEIGVKVRAGSTHIDNYLEEPTDANMAKILTTISDTRWSKGRFAHRLCSHILNKGETLDQDSKHSIVPPYIKGAIDFLLAKVLGKTQTEEGDHSNKSRTLSIEPVEAED